MPATFSVSEDGSYLIQRVIGQQTLAMQRPIIEELLSQLRTTGLQRALIDAREQRSAPNIPDAYLLWDDLASRFPRTVKFAVVVGWPILGRPFIEDVAVNRWVNIRYFNAYDEALAWLQGSG